MSAEVILQGSQGVSSLDYSRSAYQRNVIADGLRPVRGTVQDLEKQPDSRLNQDQSQEDKPSSSRPHQRVDEEELANAIENIKDFVQLVKRNLEFTVDDDTGRQIVKVIDSDTEKVIRQIPPEEVLSLAERLGEVEGLFLRVEA